MTLQFQFEVDPYAIAEQQIGPCLAAFDIETYSAELPTEAQDPVVAIGVGHTTGLGAASKVYLRCFASPSPALEDEARLLERFLDHLDLLPGGTLCAHWGFGETLEDGFDTPYLRLRCRKHHPHLPGRLEGSMARWRQHDTCRGSIAPTYVSRSLYALEDYHGLFRPEDLRVPGDQVQHLVRAFWEQNDPTLLHYNIADVYNCLRLAQNQLRKHINPLVNITGERGERKPTSEDG